MRERPGARAGIVLIWMAASVAAMLPSQFAPAQEHRVFDLGVTERRIAIPDRTIRAQEGDTVELRITSDEDGELHLHGYDVTIELRAGQTSMVTVEADVAGRFPATSHGFGSSADRADGHRHETLFYLEVHPR